jgi:hypothetical protein
VPAMSLEGIGSGHDLGDLIADACRNAQGIRPTLRSSPRVTNQSQAGLKIATVENAMEPLWSGDWLGAIFDPMKWRSVRASVERRRCNPARARLRAF